MSKRFQKIINIFASQNNNQKIANGSENKTIFISKDLFIQNLKQVGKKDKAEIPTITV